jgi:NADH dehydrogenase
MSLLNNHIVVLGAGYGGMLSAIKISQNIPEARVTLVDQRDYQLFSFDLYEVATADEELVSLEQLKKAITLPINNLLKGTKVEYIKSEIKQIDLKNKQVQIAGKTLNFDQLIIATGSLSDDYGIKGAKEFALPLKILEDALRIRNQIEFAFSAHTLDMTKKHLRFVVAGGGYTGCELSAELLKLKNFLCWKYNYPWEKVEILVIEAASELIPGFSKRLSKDAFVRLKDLGVEVLLSGKITEIASQFIHLSNGDKLTYDALLWTVGVKGRELNITPKAEADRKNRLVVNEHLQLKGYNNVFALGDTALVLNEQGHPVPCSAQDAIDQAKYLAKTLPAILKNQKPPKYVPIKHGFIVCMGGKWAIMDYKGWYIKGFLAYAIDQFAHIRYLAKLMGWVKASLFVWFQVKIFGRND